MSTYTSEPGTRLAGRYRLVDQMSAGDGWTYWKATDETLARPVTVLTFTAGFRRIAQTVAAARAASRVGDPRLAQVFDVEDTGELPYLVTEWVVGESLLDMLSDGPLESSRAAALVADAAHALAAAHAAGLAHLRLDPACLHWTPGSGVKISGLGIDAALADAAALAGEDAEDPDRTDTRGLARLLYAALTGYWPGLPGSGGAAEPGSGLLPPAPATDQGPCTPRQVSADVPANIDDVTCRALFQRPSRHGPALSTPAMLADALTDIAPPASLLSLPAAFSLPAARPPAADRGYRASGPTNPYPAADPATPAATGSSYLRPPAGQRSTLARVLVGVVIVLVLAAVGVAAWSVGHGSHHATTPPPGRTNTTAPAATASTILKPVSANSFDALGNDAGNENGAEAKYAIDGNPSTFWHTDFYYTYPRFGNLKKGTGLILDMGKEVRLSQLVVQFGTSCCAHVDIEIGNDDNPVPAALSTFTVVQGSDAAVDTMRFTITSDATGRYVLIWITDLPPLAGSPGEYQAQIYNVVVYGSAVSQPG